MFTSTVRSLTAVPLRDADPVELPAHSAPSGARSETGAGLNLEGWNLAIEHMALMHARAGHRCVGVMGVQQGDGVSTYAGMLSEILRKTGCPTLLVDLASTARSPAAAGFWSPYDSVISGILNSGLWGATLTARPHSTNRLLFHNAAQLRRMFEEAMKSYAAVVVDLAPAVRRASDAINPLAAAAACDAVVLVGTRGRSTKSDLRCAVELSHSANVNLTGIVLNERGYASPAAEIAQRARRALCFTPRLSRWVAGALERSELLN